jgi:hypothetical protein
MEIQEFIQIIDELSHSWKTVNNDENYGCNAEVTMWRERFISAQNLTRFESICFMAIPSVDFMKKTIEEHLQEIKES